MGRGDGSGDGTLMASKGSNTTRTLPWMIDGRTDEEVDARFQEIKEWEATPASENNPGTREHLESFISRLASVDYEKASAANRSRIPDDTVEAYALRVLEDEARDYKVLSDIIHRHRATAGFESNPGDAPKADDYSDEEISALSPEGVEKEEGRKKAEEYERWKESLSLDEFKGLANKADWYYEFTDDERDYRRGEAEVNRIKNIAKGHPERERTLEEMAAKMPHASF